MDPRRLVPTWAQGASAPAASKQTNFTDIRCAGHAIIRPSCPPPTTPSATFPMSIFANYAMQSESQLSHVLKTRRSLRSRSHRPPPQPPRFDSPLRDLLRPKPARAGSLVMCRPQTRDTSLPPQQDPSINLSAIRSVLIVVVSDGRKILARF